MHDKTERLPQRWAHAAAASALLLGSGVAATFGGSAVSAAATADSDIHYVALGDSFAAGSGVFPEHDVSACFQSELNYPKVVAAQLHATSFRDATCGGATLTDLHDAQPAISGSAGSSAPQFDSLTPDTTLVTMTMGGNDIGLAAQALACFNALPQPHGHSCTEQYTADGRDGMGERLAALAPGYDRALDDIHARAPLATVVIVGYPTAAPPGGCPQQPAWPADVDYLNSVLGRLNDVLRTAATRHGDRYVDTATPSVGHDMCQTPDRQWINGLIPSFASPALAPLHPNAAGEQAIADEVVATLG
ncbi:SGNH/GDSL hydrolase family protein [Nocardia sp. alder85J]|uniref:SGNH/GDSL hydrolase family protein n=1 Tax=Nocardia sp. alder85J TaxID=2862949 RepID=UPI001CD506F3|nr:SGNH/GDSL hydrolase family protein [Nocardia sp. alder85J]MCX4090822.1 SGNH/GDSL hydrolase family protein [Nocardia sp. alder85J]